MKKMFDFFKSSEKSKIKKTEVIVLATPTCISLADFTHSKVIYFFFKLDLLSALHCRRTVTLFIYLPPL